MNPLLDEYFKRDLDDHEEEQLGRWLASSGEGTQRLVGLMESHYRDLGPQAVEPEWPETPLPAFFPKADKGTRPTFRIGFVLMLCLAAYYIHPCDGNKTAHPFQNGSSTVQVDSEGARKGASGDPAAMKERIPSVVGKTYEELSVVVENPRPGLVTVRVLDGQAGEVRLLYAGILPAGNRTFVWDGRGPDGKTSLPGNYSLVVSSGGKTMRKTVHVRPVEP